VRFANADELSGYEAGSSGEVIEVGARETFEETLFLGLRLNEGIPAATLRERFPAAWAAECEERVSEMARGGLMRVEGDVWMLTGRGRLVSNEVFGELLAVAV
jgi:oxygen-independent coproporphyrinogen-3 oxidase